MKIGKFCIWMAGVKASVRQSGAVLSGVYEEVKSFVDFTHLEADRGRHPNEMKTQKISRRVTERMAPSNGSLDPRHPDTTLIILILVIGFLFSACGGKKSETKTMSVDVGSITKGVIEQNVLFTGNIEGKDSGDIYPKASGVVSKKLVEEGVAIKAGQPVVLVDRDEVGYKFKDMPVESPIDGVVGRFYVEVGSYVRDRNAGGDTPIALVYKPSVMRVKLDIPERYLERIPLGSIVSMSVDSLVGESFSGSITSMSSVDEKTRTSKIEIDMPNPSGKLKHGMFGKLYLTMEKHEDVLIAPLDSISWEGAKRFVFKVENGAVKRTEVETGLRGDKTVEILKGVGEGDMVVVGNLLNMKDGEKVSVRTK